MKESIRKVFDKIEPQGTDSAFIGAVTGMAKRKNKSSKIFGAVAAVMTLAVVLGAARAYFIVKSEVYVTPLGPLGDETEITTQPALTPREIFILCGAANADALGIAFTPDYKVLENTYDGVDFEVAAIADDFHGGLYAVFKLTCKNGFGFNPGSEYGLKQSNSNNFVVGFFPGLAKDGTAYAAVLIYDKSIAENPTFVFELNGMYEIINKEIPSEQIPYANGYAKIEIDRSKAPECPVFRAEHAGYTVTPLGVHSDGTEIITAAEFFAEDGTSVYYNLMPADSDGKFYIALADGISIIDVDNIVGISIIADDYDKNDNNDNNDDYYTTVIADDEGNIISN